MSDEDGSNGAEEEDEGFEIGAEEKVELLGGVVLGVRDPECLSRCSRLWSKSCSSPTSLSYFASCSSSFFTPRQETRSWS